MNKRVGIPRFISNGQIFTILLVVILTVLAVKGRDINIPWTAEQRAKESATLEEIKARWNEERQERQRREPFDLAVYILTRLAALALALGAGAGLISVLTLRGWRWAATIAPVGGLFPLLLSKIDGRWTLFDANRSPTATTELGRALVAPGWEQAQVLTALAASKVQVEQARTYSSTINTTNAAPAPAQNTEQAPVQWPSSVSLSDLLARQGGASLDKIILGVSPGDNGEWELVNPSMSRMVHVGIGAASGWGKSTLLHTILAQFVLAGGLGLALADASGSALGQWRDCNLLQWPLATDASEITALFVAMGEELDRRAELYTQAGSPNNLSDYNKRRGELPALEPLSLVADEANSILKSNAAASQAAENLAYRGRKFGLWLVLSGQRWTKDEIPTGLTNQLSTRLAFKMNSKAQSNNLLMSGDAAGLNNLGRGIALVPGRARVEFQAPLICEDEISALLTGHTGPRMAAPVIVDVKPEKAKPVAKLSPHEQERAKELGAQGESTTAILKDLFGAKGKSGPRALAVNLLLGRV